VRAAFVGLFAGGCFGHFQQFCHFNQLTFLLKGRIMIHMHAKNKSGKKLPFLGP
jgi:hypothetical protein